MFFPFLLLSGGGAEPKHLPVASFRHLDKLLLAGMSKQVEIRSPAPCGMCGVAHRAAVPAPGHGTWWDHGDVGVRAALGEWAALLQLAGDQVAAHVPRACPMSTLTHGH